MPTEWCGCDLTHKVGCVLAPHYCERHLKERHMGEPQSTPVHVDSTAEELTRGVVEIPNIKNSGVFHTSSSGMKRDANPQGAIDYSNILHGPMYDRWAGHLTKAKVKYPDAAPGVPNWTLGANLEDYLRFRESAFRHLRKWMNGQRDEDHAAAVYFNLNGAEYVRNRLNPDERRKLNDLEERWAAFQEENHGAQ